MTLSTRVLLIEDDIADQSSVRERMLSVGFQVDVLTSSSRLDILNFTAKDDYFVVIVDEGLAELPGAESSGFQLIVKHLWEYDSSMRFIHFSTHEKLHLHRDPSALPAIKYLAKRRENGCLSSACLDQLVESTRAYFEKQMPTFRVDDYLALLQSFRKDVARCELTKQKDAAVADSIMRSGELLSDMTIFATALSRLGVQSDGLTVGVFGSYGRMEASERSDIELSVLFDQGSDSVAVNAWNRVFRYCRVVHSRSVEGENEIGTLLTLEKAAELATPERLNIPYNAFIPIYCPDVILDKNSQRLYPHLLFRHYQILAEMCPIFNPDHLASVKMRIIGHDETAPVMNTREILITSSMKKICDLVFTYMSDESKPTDEGRFKELLFRRVGVLAFRVILIHYARNEQLLGTKAEISRMFQLLAAPPIVKLQVARTAFQYEPSTDTLFEKLIDTCANAFRCYMSNEANANRLNTFREDVHKQFADLFDLLESGPCTVFPDRCKWIFDSSKEVRNGAFAPH